MKKMFIVLLATSFICSPIYAKKHHRNKQVRAQEQTESNLNAGSINQNNQPQMMR